MFSNHSRTFDAGTPVLSADHGAMGLFPGTRIETESGWRDVASLVRGDRVYTADGGLRPVLDLRAERAGGPAVRLPAGTLGADSDCLVAPGQLLLLDTGWAIDWLGTPVALARAGDLVGRLGVRMRAAPADRLIVPVMAEEEVLYAATGLRVFAPGATTFLGPEFFTLLDRSEVSEVLEASGQARAA